MKLRFKRDFQASLFGDSEVFVAVGKDSVYKVEESFAGWALVVTKTDESFKLLPGSKVRLYDSKGEAMDAAESME